MTDPIAAAAAATVQTLPDADQPASRGFAYTTRQPLLPPWGTQAREQALRDLYRNDFNWLVRGAFAGVMTLIATTPWEIRGPARLSPADARYYDRLRAKQFGRATTGARADIDYWQQVFRQAHFGRGWNDFIRMGVDYLRHDRGWFIEVIAPGDPNEPPTGAVLGLAHLDALRCIPTGDPEYPVIYMDVHGTQHQLHRTRVICLQDMPDHDERTPGCGLCALSRAVSTANLAILMEQYNIARLDDQPPPGIVVASNISKQERDAAWRAFQAEQQLDARPVWGRQLWFYGLDAQSPARIETLSFQQPPEQWDYPEWVRVSVQQLALALGVDVQELWELSGGSIGTATQSAILHAKSRGKTIGNLRTALERALNDVLPEPYEFQFAFSDYEEDAQRAGVAATWAGIATTVRDLLGSAIATALLTNTIPEVRNAQTEVQNPNYAVADDVDVGAEALPTPASPRPVAGDVGRSHDADLAVDARAKAIQATVLDFEATLAALFAAAKAGELAPLRLGTILRAELRRYGMKAMLDGLRDGGVTVDRLTDEDDLATFHQWMTEQVLHVSRLVMRIRRAELDAWDRATLWTNKSLLAIYHAGVASADYNSLYKWVYGDTIEHCKDCARFNGQVHRMQTWMTHGKLPQGNDLACGGFFCKCRLVKTAGRARGRL